MIIFFFLGFISAALMAVFALQNTGLVTVKFFNYEFEGSMALICAIVFSVGFLTHFFISLPGRVRRKWSLYQSGKKIKDLEDELMDREKRPVFDDHDSPPDSPLQRY